MSATLAANKTSSSGSPTGSFFGLVSEYYAAVATGDSFAAVFTDGFAASCGRWVLCLGNRKEATHITWTMYIAE